MNRKLGLILGSITLLILSAVAFGMYTTGNIPIFNDNTVAAPQNATSNGFFYRVDGGANDVYLFGSLHFGNQDMYPLHPSVEDTFQNADELVMEIDMGSLSQDEIEQRMLEHGTYDDRRMTDIVDQDTFDTTYSILQNEYDRDTVNRMKPWYAANKVSQETIKAAGYNPDNGTEDYLVEQAEAYDIPITGLETVDAQAAAFNMMSDESQDLYLRGTIYGYNNDGENLQDLAQGWQTGSETVYTQQRHTMRTTAQTASMEAFYNALLDQREEHMASEITDMLEDDNNNTYFVTVGSLHLVGDNSIPDNLEDQGYTVTDMYE